MEANNMKAMREAVEAINCIDTRGLKRLLCELVEADIFDGGLINKTISAIEKARRALSEPPRQCDRFATWEEAMQSFRRLALHEKPLALWLGSEIEGFARWLFASSQEGATDGSK